MKALWNMLMKLLGLYQEEPVHFDPEQNGRWKLFWGYHRGDYSSLSANAEYFATEQEAEDHYRRQKKHLLRYGYFIWFAYLYTPEGKQLRLDLSTPYKRPD